MNFNLKKYREKMDKKELIFCPHCGKEQDNDDFWYPVTNWGEDIVEYSCAECGKDFWIKECVRRTYETMDDIT